MKQRVTKITCIILGACVLSLSAPNNTAKASDLKTLAESVMQPESFGENDIPKEVKERIAEIKRNNPKAIISISCTDGSDVEPSDSNNGIGLQSTDSSWGKYRTYKKMKMRDWIVTTKNAHAMESIAEGKKNQKFFKAIPPTVVYVGATVAGKVKPEIGTCVGIIQYLLKMNNVLSNTYSARAGDKLMAAPMYTTKEKFTYVYVGNQAYLGTKSYYSKIDSISWYFYYSKYHKQCNYKTSAPKTVYSENYKNPDPKALIYYGSGGYIDGVPAIKINSYKFLLN